ncbi:serine dehydratase alpha chain-domain-containing protein [Gamsiella multidivaricata]|uniref:serine dehydratase alpha chain-domain-containing protein n=1 Tax=Gamsiella multidivaricata TaxID=101098 RepID=UPI00221F7E09|nr:serine dehydratase alpha chain-domain-containing protein [Gamsiella multidivaricata]KAI7823543.1 serine dehydratase alpha chain-domain-containing protein [Gamsiella multidivaricata]
MSTLSRTRSLIPRQAHLNLPRLTGQARLYTNTTSRAAPTKHAVVSTFDLFSIGIGPSSSHTVGPMRAAKIFVTDLKDHSVLDKVASLRIDLFGSLALTGIGHGTPDSILMGMEGESPESVETSTIQARLKAIDEQKALTLDSTNRIKFDPAKDLVFHYFESLPQHPNGMRFCAFNDQGDLLATNEYFSIGGGFVVNERTQLAHGENVFYKNEQDKQTKANKVVPQTRRSQDLATAALPFTNATELLELCQRENMTIAQVVLENELRWRSMEEIKEKTFAIWNTMDNAIKNGCLSSEEMLPGRLRVRRRAPGLYKKLLKGLYTTTPLYKDTSVSAGGKGGLLGTGSGLTNQTSERGIDKVLPKRAVKRLMLPALDYLSVYAIAVNEENAAGGRVVTAPTNGAAGVIPAVLKYYLEFISDNPEQDIMEFILTTAAIGMLYKRGASISAAEMGCQGEVGVACSMASAGFAAVMGGTVQQVENAAEIGMEHNLGLTCDPIDGLVQIPCIERNALGAVKAVTAAQLALNGDGHHRVTLDQVIETMRQTGNDMQAKYKETSQGGLSVCVPVC